MFKKIALFGAAACFAVTTAASATGLYVGAGLGYQTTKTDVNTTAPSTVVAGTTDTTSNDFHGDGINGTLFVGYGFCANQNIWLGLEFNGELSSTKHSQNSVTNVAAGTTLTVSTEHKLRGGYGLSFRPGYFVTDNTKVYGVLGWQRGRFQTTSTVAITGLGTATGRTNTWENGFRYGGGMEVNLTNQLGLRAEFTQTRYKTRTNTVAVGAVGNATARIKDYSNQAMVDLVWTIGDVANIGNSLSGLTS
jgi:opacity protein-like surface antigen